MLSRRTRAAASKEAAAAASAATTLSAVSTTTALDDSYCASPKRKDCKLDTDSNKSPVNLELNVRVSVHSPPGGIKRNSNSLTRANQAGGKGKRQSPQAITNFFASQTKPDSPNQCVHLHEKFNQSDKSIDEEADANVDDVVTNGCSPRHRQLNKQARDNDVPDAATAGAICEPETPKKSASQDRAGVKMNEMKSPNAGHASHAHDDSCVFLSPEASNRNGLVKQNTPHRMVITSPVKPTRRITKPTVASFSQLKIGDSSPTSKKTGSKTDKKTRRRLQVNGSENFVKTSSELSGLASNVSDESEPVEDDILVCDIKANVDTKKPLVNSSTDPTAHQNTTNNIKSVPPRLQPPKPITDFFPIRRSVRKTKKEVEDEFLQRIGAAIDKDIEEGLLVETFPDKGRGIVAARAFARGEFVVEYVGDLIDQTEAQKREEFYAKDSKFGCYMYYFKYQGQQWCIDATAESGKCGRLLNHSRNGNLITKVINYNKQPRLILIAKDDIPAGTELTYDYGDRRREALLNHPWLAY